MEGLEFLLLEVHFSKSSDRLKKSVKTFRMSPDVYNSDIICFIADIVENGDYLWFVDLFLVLHEDPLKHYATFDENESLLIRTGNKPSLRPLYKFDFFDPIMSRIPVHYNLAFFVTKNMRKNWNNENSELKSDFFLFDTITKKIVEIDAKSRIDFSKKTCLHPVNFLRIEKTDISSVPSLIYFFYQYRNIIAPIIEKSNSGKILPKLSSFISKKKHAGNMSIILSCKLTSDDDIKTEA